ncbi:MAG: hypothetical protein ACFFFB_04210 [Candidatus Heimdallarchaeota archaeon]
MRPLDLFGMIATIIGINFIIAAILFMITIPPPVYPYTSILKPIRIFIAIIFIIGALAFIVGIISRTIDYITKDKVSNRELLVEIVDKIVNYLKNNKGKAFTVNALLKRIHKENQIEINQDILELFMRDLVMRNVITSQFKDGQEFFIYTKDT